MPDHHWNCNLDKYWPLPQACWIWATTIVHHKYIHTLKKEEGIIGWFFLPLCLKKMLSVLIEPHTDMEGSWCVIVIWGLTVMLAVINASLTRQAPVADFYQQNSGTIQPPSTLHVFLSGQSLLTPAVFHASPIFPAPSWISGHYVAQRGAGHCMHESDVAVCVHLCVHMYLFCLCKHGKTRRENGSPIMTWSLLNCVTVRWTKQKLNYWVWFTSLSDWKKASSPLISVIL